MALPEPHLPERRRGEIARQLAVGDEQCLVIAGGLGRGDAEDQNLAASHRGNLRQ